MFDRKNTIPISKLIIIVFMIAMVLTISGIGYLVFSGWSSSAKLTTRNIEKIISDTIFSQLNSFLIGAEKIHEANKDILAKGILDIADTEHREQFFVGILNSSTKETYSFSYGTVNGEYFGARRNQNGAIEIMRNDESTGGESWYYAVQEDSTAGDVVYKAGTFDPRTRAWFKAATDEGGLTFSPLYKHFVMDDLALSSAYPLYSQGGILQGVLSAHMLLKGIGGFLESSVNKYNGYAGIIETDSHKMISNSMGIENYTSFEKDKPERPAREEVQMHAIQDAYEHYLSDLEPNFFYRMGGENLYVSIREIHRPGLDWVIISAIPEELLLSPVLQSVRFALVLVLLSLVVSFTVFLIMTKKLFKPVGDLLEATDAMSFGDLTRRVEISRNDEIGKISTNFNTLASKIQFLVHNLEATVEERNEELQKSNSELERNRNQLRLILDSTAEAVYGIDVDGNCTFCNRSCIKILGYTDQTELLGKNMHYQIHYDRVDGTPLPVKECKIFQAFYTGLGTHADDEVFWKSDGTFFDVEYNSYPQIREGKIVGAVVTFIDITDRKRKEEKIQYLIGHDTLTGLQNRRGFEDNRTMLDIPANLPLSVIFADINGLKMTNDIFGHTSGDELIKKAAEILKRSCRENDLIARVGGDEFVLLLPKTTGSDAQMILERIGSEFLGARVEAVKCSTSLGLDTKTSPNQSLDEIIANAENKMYKNKILNRKTINKGMIDTLIETLYIRSPRERQHSIAVSELSSEVGLALHLSETEISKLGRTGYLHDIGKIVIPQSILSKELLSKEDLETIQQHPMVGYRILNLFDDTLDLAEYVYSHHERWDGKGYPQGLKNGHIPLISRIVSIVETYDSVISRGKSSHNEKKLEALEVIRKGAGTQFDPDIAELFVQMMEEKDS